MNNKRQTIWLVSMLSLMVILSAYYLFTEDVTPERSASQSSQQTGQPDGSSKTSGDTVQGIQVTEVDPATDSITDAGKDGSKDQAAPPEGGSETGARNDEAVLKELASLKGAEYFDEIQRLNKEKFDQENERLTSIVADTKNHSQEEASSAVEELARLDDADSRMTSLEEKLLLDYENAVVTEEDMNFKVIVQAAKLEKKQAVKIVDMAAKVLNVTPDRLSVQYVP